MWNIGTGKTIFMTKLFPKYPHGMGLWNTAIQEVDVTQEVLAIPCTSLCMWNTVTLKHSKGKGRLI